MTRTMGLAPDLATFQRLVGTGFLLRLDGETNFEVELSQLKDSSSPPFEIFLVPVGRTEAGLQYEAVFNRRIEPGAGGD